MSIFDFFFGRKQNENNSRRSVKLNRRAVRTRNLAMEPLETRDLLSVTTGLIDDSAYAALRAQYPDFNLPEEQSELNVMTVDCNLSDLKSAITQAGTSPESDLILIKTTDSTNTITYSSSSDEIKLNIASATSGSVTIIGWGTKELTINANLKCRVMSISGATDANFGNITFTKGKVSSSTSAYGGGIYSTSSGALTLTNCTISSNTASSTSTDSYGGGIYSSTGSKGTLTLTNCTITSNTSASSSSTGGSYSYGGGIYSTGSLTLYDSFITSNTSTSTVDSHSGAADYSCAYGGGIFNNSGKLTLFNSFITNNTSISSCSYARSTYDTSYPDTMTVYSCGGGIYAGSSSGSLTLTNCTISSNSITSNAKYSNSSSYPSKSITAYSNGSGIYYGVTNGSLILTNSTISNNSASSISTSSTSSTAKSYCYGGGLYNSSTGTLTISGCNIFDNSFQNGSNKYGADYYMTNNASKLSIIDSKISSSSDSKSYFNTSGNAIIDNNSLTYVSISSLSTSDNSTISNNNLSNSSVSISGNVTTLSVNESSLFNSSISISGNVTTLSINEGSLSNSSISISKNVDEISVIDSSLIDLSISIPGNVTTLSVNEGSLSNSSISISQNVNELSVIDSSLIDSSISISGNLTTLSIDDSNINSTSNKRTKLQVSNSSMISNCSLAFVSIKASADDFAINNTSLYEGAYITISDGKTSISECSLSEGSHIEITGGDLVILNSSFTGSAYINSSSGKTSVSKCTLTETLVNIFEGIMSVSESTLTDGAYISITGGKTSIANSSIVGTGSGKGIDITNGDIDTNLSVSNSIIRDYEYGIYTKAQINAAIVNSTITNNSSYGICVNSPNAVFNICNSIVAKNYFFSDVYKVSDATVNAHNSLSSFANWTFGYDNIFYNGSLPLFVDENNSDYCLAENSPAINAGNNTYAIDVSTGQPLTTDLAGIPRILGSRVDIGAYEYDSDGRTKLSAPEFTAASLGSSAAVNITEVEGASGYIIEYSADSNFTNSTILDAQAGENILEDLQELQTYYVRVKSIGNEDYYDSDFSTAQSFVTLPALTGLTLSTDTPEVGTVITTELTPANATATYQWYCDETIIDGATTSSFTVTEDQIGQTITCVATGTGDYTGTVSATTEVVPGLALESPSELELTAEDTTVTASWKTVENASAYTLLYQIDGTDGWTTVTDIQGTTTFFVGIAGTTYNVKVQANGTGIYGNSDYSETASITLRTPLTSLALSSIAPEVGTEIIASLIPTDATADYQWYCGETIIEGATGSTFIVTEDQIGQTITCVATGTGDYSGTVSMTTAVVPVPVTALEAPADLALSAENTAITATWSAVENASSYTLLYQIDGADGWTTVSDIQSSTASFIGIAGMTYNVKVQANGTGDYSDSEFSNALSIKLYIPITSLTLSTDSPIVGSTITASLIPTDATADYQWFSGETLIEGATGSSFVVTEDQIGQTITCVATGTGDYTGTVSMTTAVVPVPVTALDAPANVALSVYNATVTASWSAVENASSYTLEYKPIGAENWTALPGLEDTTASFVGVSGTMYNVRVKAVGTGDYSDSPYTEINTDKPTGPVVAINANKVTVSWVDDSPAADSVRYRVAGTTRWTVKKLNAGITEMSFNATIGANYEIEVLLDQQENNVLQGSAIVLDQPRLTSIRNELKDDTFQVNVTNYAAKNLAANVKQAIVSVNGVMTTLKIADQQGETALANGGKVAFSNGLFTFSEMNSNTSYKVMISFSDGHSVSKASTALTVKTLKAPYLPPVIVSANAVSDTAITVTWETAYGKKSTTPAQKYTVQYSTDGNKWTNATTGATGNSYTIQRLKGGVEYQVRVLATKGAAFEASAPSGVLSAQTLTLPKTVLDKASVKDDTFKLDVTNYATSNLVNAPMLNVKSDKFGEAAIAIQNGSGSATFENGMVAAFENGALTFTNVPSNTQQKIQINFSDGVCTTAWSAALTVKTAIASYNKPILTNAEAVSSTSVLVEWSPAVGKNSDIPAQSYTVQYSTDGNRWTNANTKVVGTSFTITGLKTGTTYLVAVIANKDSRFNASLPSESLEVRML